VPVFLLEAKSAADTFAPIFTRDALVLLPDRARAGMRHDGFFFR